MNLRLRYLNAWHPWSVTLVALFFAVFWISSSWNHHAKIPGNDWRSDLRVDGAGYYIYLPGMFHYGMRAKGLPLDLTERTADGFIVHYARDRIITKYTCGVALLELPFYLIAESIVGWGATDGFTDTHRRAVEAGAILYWIIGLLLTALALQRLLPAPPWVPVVLLPLIAFGSSLFYYAFRAADFSHVYSFAMVALALYLFVTRILDAEAVRPPGLFGFGITCALIVLIRPTDAVIVLGFIAWIMAERPALLRRPAFWGIMAFTALVVWSPQLAYWRFVHGRWLAVSYDNEAFTNLLSPHVLKFLFAAENGWLPYAPAMLLLPAGSFVLWKQRPHVVIILFAVLAFTVYLCSAWHMWNFGCGFGSRPLVQYLPLLAIPIWAWLRSPGPTAKLWRAALLPLLFLLVFVNYRLALQYDGCFFGKDPWDWDYFGRGIAHAFLG